jgi:phage terminase large subunit
MKITLSSSFEPLLGDRHRYLVLCGGAGSGKTEFAARKLFYRCQTEGGHRFLVLRKVRSRVKESVLEVFLTLLRENGIVFEFNRTDRIISWNGSDGRRNEVLFDGLDDPEKIKSIKGITGEWLEETTEFTKNDFLQLDLRLREPGPAYHQIILSFNPDEAQAPWLKEMFFDRINPDALVHHSTIKDNPIPEVRKRYSVRLDGLKAQDETMYSIYGLGLWAIARGKIYNWDVVVLPDIKFDEIFYGGDFGYSVNPSTVVKVYRKADEFWVEEIIYQDSLTNPMLAVLMKDKGVCKWDVVYFDSSEPKSIDEIATFDINAKPALKGPDSVRAGIGFLKSKHIHVIDGSENIIKEAAKYSWKTDKKGNPIPEPVKFDDHAMDAIRYAILTHCTADTGVFIGQSKQEFY